MPIQPSTVTLQCKLKLLIDESGAAIWKTAEAPLQAIMDRP